MAPKVNGNKGKARSHPPSTSERPVEVLDDSDDGGESVASAKQHEAGDGEVAEEHPHEAGSEAGSYDGEFMDPALFDEEEFPHGDSKPPGSGSKNTTTWQGPGGGGYNAIKNFNGQIYSGMAIGGSHTWNYQPGIWKETKKEPDLWEIDYKTNKVRNHKAPAGSGAPVGTEYHWYIVAHQYVKKIDANTYETHLTGSKYKLAHKNVNSKNWDIPTVKGQRDREIFLLEDAKRRIEGLPPVLSSEKVKIDKKEKGQATLGSFFQSSPNKKRKENPASPEEASNGISAKKALKTEKNQN